MFDISSLLPLTKFSWKEINLRPQDIRFFDYYGINYCEMLGIPLQYHFGEFELGGYSIATHYIEIQENKGSVVLVHGYMDHVGLYNHLIEALLRAGYNVLAYDLPGHGLSSGEQAGIADFSDYQKVLSDLLHSAQDNLPKPWYLVGQSTGGAIAMDYLMNNPLHEFDKAVVMAPLVVPQHWAYIKFQLFVMGWFLKRVPREFAENSGDNDFLYFLKHKDPLQTRYIAGSWVKALYHWQKHFTQSKPSDISLLVIQGDNDLTVDWQYNLQRVEEKFPNYKEVLIKGARHHLVRESEPLRRVVFSRILDFIIQE